MNNIYKVVRLLIGPMHIIIFVEHIELSFYCQNVIRKVALSQIAVLILRELPWAFIG